MSEEATKVCKECGVPKPLSEFHRNKLTKDGREGKCKKCRHTRGQQWFKDNPEAAKRIRRRYYYSEKGGENRRSWQKANQEKLRRANRKHYHSHLEHERKRSNNWNKRNRDWYKNWLKANPDKQRRYQRNHAIKHPEGYLARLAVRLAVLRGELPPVKTLQCSNCPNSARDYHHHRGYAQEHWLDVIPVCRHCHKKLEPK